MSASLSGKTGQAWEAVQELLIAGLSSGLPFKRRLLVDHGAN
ncbi:MAG TPA: hypothetical protein VG944_20970 [Fimbriimonas sp.]|nr:hypothetical protein [Fimbriimonas sp.]